MSCKTSIRVAQVTGCLPELLKFTCTDGRVVNIPVEIATKLVSSSWVTEMAQR